MTDLPEYETGVPLHVQVRELIRKQALSGDLVNENGQLRTEAELVRHFGVSRVTIRNALTPLVEIGMFDRTPGRGTFLRNNRSERWVGRLMGFQEIVAEQGHVPGAEILEAGMINARDESVHLAMQERAVWQLRRVRFVDDTPIAIEHAFYPPDVGLELEKRNLVGINMYEVLEHELGFEIKTATQTIGAKLSTTDEQEALKLDRQAALAEMQRLTVAADERPLELLRSVYRPDLFQFSIKLSRRSYVPSA